MRIPELPTADPLRPRPPLRHPLSGPPPARPLTLTLTTLAIGPPPLTPLRPPLGLSPPPVSIACAIAVATIGTARRATIALARVARTVARTLRNTFLVVATRTPAPGTVGTLSTLAHAFKRSRAPLTTLALRRHVTRAAVPRPLIAALALPPGPLLRLTRALLSPLALLVRIARPRCRPPPRFFSLHPLPSCPLACLLGRLETLLLLLALPRPLHGPLALTGLRLGLPPPGGIRVSPLLCCLVALSLRPALALLAPLPLAAPLGIAPPPLSIPAAPLTVLRRLRVVDDRITVADRTAQPGTRPNRSHRNTLGEQSTRRQHHGTQ